MKLITCVDDYNGMSFNGRRQSRDRAVIEKICEIVHNSTLWMTPSSAHLFKEHNLDIRTAEDCLVQVNDCDFCFVETSDVTDHIQKVDMVCLFRWNREYPADLYFPVDQLARDFRIIKTVEFVGYSHPAVVLEVYKR